MLTPDRITHSILLYNGLKHYYETHTKMVQKASFVRKARRKKKNYKILDICLQVLIFGALLAVASAVVIPAPAYPGLHGPAYPAYHGAALLPAVAKVAVAKVAGPEPYDPNPQYSYSYDVHVSGT